MQHYLQQQKAFLVEPSTVSRYESWCGTQGSLRCSLALAITCDSCVSPEIEQSCEAVREIALKLHNENVYPSEGRVSELMTKLGDLRNKQVRVTLQELQSELSK